MRKEKIDPRFDKINELFINYSLGNFLYRADISDNLDEIDSFITSVNMLGEELQETTVAKNYFNDIINSIADLLFVVNKNGLITLINNAVVEKLNTSSTDILFKKIETVIGKEHISFPIIKKNLKKSKHYLIDTQIDSRNSFPVRLACYPLYNNEKENTGYLFIAHDLSIVRSIENSLKGSEEKYKKIFDNSGDPIFIADIHGKITTINKAGIKFFGIDSNKPLTINFFEKIHPKKTSKNLHLGLLKHKITKDFRCKISRNEEELADCLLSILSIYNNSGNITGYHGIIKDISKQKENEKLLIRTIVNTQENERIRVAKDLHDGLGQQLTAIKFFISSLMFSENTNCKEIKKMLGKSNDLLENAIKDVRDICFNLMPKTLEIKGLRQAIEELCNKISNSELLTFQLSINEPKTVTDKNLEFAIYRVIQEFINNAIKHGKASRLSIALNYELNNINILLIDNGVGFPLNKKEESKGMGLRNLQSRIESYNGEVIISSKPQKGTTFKINIPIITGTEM